MTKEQALKVLEESVALFELEHGRLADVATQIRREIALNIDDPVALERTRDKLRTLADVHQIQAAIMERILNETDFDPEVEKETPKMGCRILDGGEDGACIYDSVTGTAFGPLFDDYEHAEDFLQWNDKHNNPDPRTMSSKEISDKVDEWRSERLDDDGNLIDDEYSTEEP